MDSSQRSHGRSAGLLAGVFLLAGLTGHWLSRTAREPQGEIGEIRTYSGAPAVDAQEMREFRDEVVRILGTKNPELRVVLGQESSMLRMGEKSIYLDNAFKTVRQARTHDERRALTAEFVTQWLPALAGPHQISDAWSEVRPALRLQLVSWDLVQQLQKLGNPSTDGSPFGPIVERVADGLFRAVVIDSERTLSYALASHVSKWGVSLDEVYAAAEANLSVAAAGTKWQRDVNGTNHLVFTVHADSYEAARILLPSTRSFLAEELGSPFLFGVGHRDTLIAWSKACTSEVQARIASMVASDFSTLNHQISPNVFEARPDGIPLFRAWMPER